MTGHGVLQHHLNRFNIADDSATSKLSSNGVQDRAHLFECADLPDNDDAHLQELNHEEAEARLCWTARQRNNLKNQSAAQEKKLCPCQRSCRSKVNVTFLSLNLQKICSKSSKLFKI
jgi:hypothetical protein